jgi:hypothetical protein
MLKKSEKIRAKRMVKKEKYLLRGIGGQGEIEFLFLTYGLPLPACSE